MAPVQETYTPGKAPATDNKETKELAEFVQRELTLISRTQKDIPIVHMAELGQEPAKPRDGMIVYADGIGWDPGLGEGVYVREAGLWVKMAGSAVVSGIDSRLFSTRLNVQGATIDDSVDRIYVFRHTADIPDSGGEYVEVPDSGPVKLWQVESNGGTKRWELETHTVSIAQLGGRADAIPSFDGNGALLSVTGTWQNSFFAGCVDYVETHDFCRHILIPAGDYATYDSALPFTASLMDFTGINDALLEMTGAKIYIDLPSYSEAVWDSPADVAFANYGAIINLSNSAGITIRGGEVISNLNQDIIRSATSTVGFSAIHCRNKCDRLRIEGFGATGLLQSVGIEVFIGVYFEVDPTDAPIIEAGGSGYAVGNTVQFSYGTAVGGSQHAVLTVAAVSGGAVTALTVTNRGRFEHAADGSTALTSITLSSTQLGWAAVTLTGSGTGLVIRPFLRVGNPSLLPHDLDIDVWALRCCRMITTSGGGLRNMKFRGKGNLLQRAFVISGECQNMEIFVDIKDAWLNILEFVHYYVTPSHWTVRANYESTVSYPDFTSNSGMLTHDAQMAYPARFYNTEAYLRKSYDPAVVSNSQYVYFPYATAQSISDQQNRRHRIWGFQLHVTVDGQPGVSGTLPTPKVIGFPVPSASWPPYAAWDIRGMRVTGSMGGTAVCDLPSGAFPVDAPDLTRLHAANRATQVMIDGVAAP